MDTGNIFYLYLHWFWVATFALLGFLTIWKPQWAAVTPRNCRWLRLRDERQQQRALDALERRAEMERPSPLPGYICAGVSLTIALVAAFTHVSAGLLYPLLCFFLALISALVFIQLRNARPRRVAILAQRSPSSLIPAWLFALAVAGAFSLLVFATSPAHSLAAFIVYCSAFVTEIIAWRLGQLPAMLQGVDLAAEEFVDARIRFYRSSVALYLSIVQPFVFCSQILTQKTALEAAVQIFVSAVLIAYVIWWVRAFYRAGSFSLA